jgi:WhiB family transcriptional regulator, redox-sensing transcriptional regulator
VTARWVDSLNGKWRLRAACNPHTRIAPDPFAIPQFHPVNEAEELSLQEQREAALFCNTACPVQSECLAFAMDVGEENGVWGGTTETERRLLMRKDRQRRKDQMA